MVEPMVSATAFSKAAGVHLTAVTAAIKQGRLQAYGKSGRRVSASFRGPKFLKLDEARQSFDESRIRLDGSFLAKESEKSGPPRRDLLAARTRRPVFRLSCWRCVLLASRAKPFRGLRP